MAFGIFKWTLKKNSIDSGSALSLRWGVIKPEVDEDGAANKKLAATFLELLWGAFRPLRFFWEFYSHLAFGPRNCQNLFFYAQKQSKIIFIQFSNQEQRIFTNKTSCKKRKSKKSDNCQITMIIMKFWSLEKKAQFESKCPIPNNPKNNTASSCLPVNLFWTKLNHFLSVFSHKIFTSTFQFLVAGLGTLSMHEQLAFLFIGTVIWTPGGQMAYFWTTFVRF